MAPAAGLAGPYGAGARSGSRGRALPIVVASGLAMGVFAGLIVVRGTGGDDGPPPVAPGVVAPAPGSPAPASPPPGSTTGVTTPPGSSTPGSSTPSAPSEPASTTTPPEAGVATAPPSEATPPARSSASLKFSVKPRRVHILIDGVEIEGTSAEVPLLNGTATVEVVVRGRGYKTFTRSYIVTDDQEIEVKLSRERDEPSGPGGQLDIR